MPRFVIFFEPGDGIKAKGQHLAFAAETLSLSKSFKRYRKGVIL